MAKKRRTCCVVLVSDLFYERDLLPALVASSHYCQRSTLLRCDAPTNLSIGVSCKAKRTSFGNMSAWHQKKQVRSLSFHRHRVAHLNGVEHLLLPQISLFTYINTEDYSVCARRLVFAQAKIQRCTKNKEFFMVRV